MPSRSDDSLNTIQGVNRQLAPRHANNIQRYLKETDNWTLGSITLAIDPEAIAYSDGRLAVTPTADNPLRIIAGQHRRRAIANLLAGGGDTERFGDQHMAICLYAEGNLRDQRQMFASLAEQKPIDHTTRLAFDTTDPFNNTARWAAEELPLLIGRGSSDKSGAVGTRDEYLLTIGDVKDIVAILTLSYGGRITPTLKKHHLQESESSKMEQNVADFFQMLAEARTEIGEIAAGDVPNAHIAIRRQDTWALDPHFLRFAAGCHHTWRQSHANADALVKAFTAMDLRKSAFHDGEMKTLGLIDEQKGKAVQRNHPQWKTAIQAVCQRANESQ